MISFRVEEAAMLDSLGKLMGNTYNSKDRLCIKEHYKKKERSLLKRGQKEVTEGMIFSRVNNSYDMQEDGELIRRIVHLYVNAYKNITVGIRFDWILPLYDLSNCETSGLTKGLLF